MILILNSDASAAEDLRRLLQRCEYRAEICEDVEAARSFLSCIKPRLLVIDDDHSDGGAISLLEEIRGNPFLSTVPVVIYTEKSDESRREQALRLNGNYVQRSSARWTDVLGTLLHHHDAVAAV